MIKKFFTFQQTSKSGWIAVPNCPVCGKQYLKEIRVKRLGLINI